MTVLGFSLSSGGLLLPYHLGALDGLRYHGYLTDSTPLAGASAGAIAVTAQSCQMNSLHILQDTIEISDTCHEAHGGWARGNLLPLLKGNLQQRITEDRFQAFSTRSGPTVLTYHELFPNFRSIHATEFADKDDLIRTVCHSSTFPFFTTHWPAALDYSDGDGDSTSRGAQPCSWQLPRLVVDGYFAVPLERFGCPDFAKTDAVVDRTVSICPFPHHVILGMSQTFDEENQISPAVQGNGIQQSARLLGLAVQPSSAQDLTELYDSGFQDAERWCREEEDRRVLAT